MTAINQNVTIYQDRTVELIIPITDQFGNFYDIGPGASAEWAMGLNAQACVTLQCSSGSGTITLTQGTIGGVLGGTGVVWIATVIILPANTQSIPPQTYYHELAVMDSVGDIVNVTTGLLTLLPSLNNPY